LYRSDVQFPPAASHANSFSWYNSPRRRSSRSRRAASRADGNGRGHRPSSHPPTRCPVRRCARRTSNRGLCERRRRHHRNGWYDRRDVDDRIVIVPSQGSRRNRGSALRWPAARSIWQCRTRLQPRRSRCRSRRTPCYCSSMSTRTSSCRRSISSCSVPAYTPRSLPRPSTSSTLSEWAMDFTPYVVSRPRRTK